jgi:hypothetical protein
MATQADFKVKNGLQVVGNSFVTAVGTSADRVTSYSAGQFRYNSTLAVFETYISSSAGDGWVSVGNIALAFPFGDLGSLTTDFTNMLGTESLYAYTYDCSTTPFVGSATIDLNV